MVKSKVPQMVVRVLFLMFVMFVMFVVVVIEYAYLLVNTIVGTPGPQHVALLAEATCSILS